MTELYYRTTNYAQAVGDGDKDGGPNIGRFIQDLFAQACMKIKSCWPQNVNNNTPLVGERIKTSDIRNEAVHLHERDRERYNFTIDELHANPEAFKAVTDSIRLMLLTGNAIDCSGCIALRPINNSINVDNNDALSLNNTNTNSSLAPTLNQNTMSAGINNGVNVGQN